jgi:hypothetical protein
LGNPLLFKGFGNRRNQFHDTELSSRIDNAFHALAIDEKRKNFEATLWLQQAHSVGQVLEQVWFPGVHSDVGGGYAENESGLSDIAMQWMLEKAQSCNLNFDSIPMKPNPMATTHESYRGFYKLQSRLFRPIGIAETKQGKTNELIHPLVLERYKKDPNYRPKNLVDYFNKHPF